MIKLKSLMEIFSIRDIRNKFFFTLFILAVYRIGAIIPTPGIDGAALKAFFDAQNNTLFGFLDMFSGGAMNKFSIFSMGIMPYINASIIMSLLQTILPSLEKLSKEGDLGRKKLIQITRYGALVLGIIQAFGLTFMIQAMRSPSGSPVVVNGGLEFQFLAVITLTVGTVFIMWLGEQITEKGIGNGVSLIIFAGIVNRLPSAVKNVFLLLQSDGISILRLLIILTFILIIVAIVVKVEQAQRRIPIQYPKKFVGTKESGGQTSFLPIKVDQSGVISVIFAVSIISFPITMAQFFPNAPISIKIMAIWSKSTYYYHAILAFLIIFFCYFYVKYIIYN